MPTATFVTEAALILLSDVIGAELLVAYPYSYVSPTMPRCITATCTPTAPYFFPTSATYSRHDSFPLGGVYKMAALFWLTHPVFSDEY